MENELVKFKGMGDGVKIILDASAPMYELLDVLEKRILESKAFFGGGNCLIRFCGRSLTGGEKMRLEELIKKLLPLGKIDFNAEEAKKGNTADWIMEYKERSGRTGGIHPAESVIAHDTKPEKNQKMNEKEEKRMPEEEEFLSIFRSNRARLYQGYVHKGVTIRSDGHLILLGEAEPGSELIAVGNILVIGGLYGAAHAGCNGHNGSYIFAMDMKPEKLAIAGNSETYTYIDDDEAIDVYDDENEKKSVFGRFRRKKETEDIQDKNTEETGKSAVALWKNNKIEVDNFTIKIFTNSKNML
ncbi:MAG: septum site-determining protein MinC [Candidatus Ornithomonoglobus sp.]